MDFAAERLPRDCRETAETDLTIGGAKETRQKREDFEFIIVMLMEEEVMIQKTIPTTSGRWKIIRYHWVKEIDND